LEPSLIDDTPIVVEINHEDVTLVLATVALSIEIPAPVQPVLVIPQPAPVNISIPAPVHPILQIVPESVAMTVALSQGGIQGPPGPQGVRGSMLLGMYGAPGNLPSPGNEGLLPGDYAFTADGTLYQILT
jgi:hypothetical protein